MFKFLMSLLAAIVASSLIMFAFYAAWNVLGQDLTWIAVFFVVWGVNFAHFAHIAKK